MDELLTPQDLHQIDMLANVLAKEPVVGICGAGISAPLGYPTWKGLIEELLNRWETVSFSSVSPDIRYAVEAGTAHLPAVASFVKRRMNETAYHKFLGEMFDLRATVDYSREIEALVRLPVRLWMTTNYDRCLTEGLSAHLKQAVTQLDQIPFADILKQQLTLPYVVHLHGRVTEPNTVILTLEDYQQLYRRSAQMEHAVSALAPLGLLFFGYGLQDHELNACLETTKVLLGPVEKRWALLPRDPDESLQKLDLRTEQLLSLGVQPIFYPALGYDHSAREQVLDRICGKLGVEKPPSRPEFHLGWREENISVSRLREELVRLRAEARSGSILILRHCSWKDRRLTLAVESKADCDRLEEMLDEHSFWAPPKKQPVVSEPRSVTPELSQRDGTPFRFEAGQVGPNAIVNRSDLSTSEDTEVSESVSPVDRQRATEHAKALGLLKESLQESREILAPLMPTPLPFGLADCFHPVADWRLDSPVMHAWVYTISVKSREGVSSAEGRRQDKVVAITIVGRGIQGIRERLETAAYTVAMTLSSVEANVVITPGLIHLSVSEERQKVGQRTSGFFRFLSSLFGAQSKTVPPTIPEDADEAMSVLESMLADLAEKTGFVQMHRAHYEDLQKYSAAIRASLIHADRRNPIVLPLQTAPRVVTYFPVAGFPYLDHPKIVLRLSGELIDAPEMRAVLEAYHHDVIVRMVADVERRIDFWTNELQRDREQVRWFKSLSPEEQKKQSDVVTGRKILKEFGIDVQTEEHTVAATTYFLDALPRHFIPEEEEELEKLEAFHESIAWLRESPHSPVWRRCLARVFDCALRRVPLCDDARTNSLFENWCSLAESMLRLEWNRLLDQRGFVASDLFRRITFFNVDYDEESNLIDVYPNVVLDSARTVISVDGRRRVLVVEDVLDEAFARQVLDQDDEYLAAELRKVVDLADDDRNVGRSLRELAYESPRVAELICDHVLFADQPPYAFAELRTEARKQAEAATAGIRCLRMLDKLAYNTAVEFLQPEDANNPSSGKALAIAVVNCLRLGYDPMDTLRRIRDRPGTALPADIKDPMSHAMQHNRPLVDSFLDQGRLPIDEMHLTPALQLACEIDHCLEAVRLAEKFRNAAAVLELRGETLDSTFLKTETAFEAAFSAVYARAIPTLERLQSILTGKPLRSTDEAELES